MELPFTTPRQVSVRKLSPRIRLKRLHSRKVSRPKGSLSAWIARFMRSKTSSGSPKSVAVRARDLALFLEFFERSVGESPPSRWTPELSREFVKELTRRHPAPGASTINRMLGNLRKFARWLRDRRILESGVMIGVRGVKLPPRRPDWKSLRTEQVLALKEACHQRRASCVRIDQSASRDAAVFHILLETGLKESELVALNCRHVRPVGLVGVRRFGESWSFPLSQEARGWLAEYMEARGRWRGPLFVSRTGGRLAPQDVRRICHRLSQLACKELPPWNHYRANPKDLRDTFLTKVLKKHGVEVAHRVSGSAGLSTIQRLTTIQPRLTPQEEEILRSRSPF